MKPDVLLFLTGAAAVTLGAALIDFDAGALLFAGGCVCMILGPVLTVIERRRGQHR